MRMGIAQHQNCFFKVNASSQIYLLWISEKLKMQTLRHLPYIYVLCQRHYYFIGKCLVSDFAWILSSSTKRFIYFQSQHILLVQWSGSGNGNWGWWPGDWADMTVESAWSKEVVPYCRQENTTAPVCLGWEILCVWGLGSMQGRCWNGIPLLESERLVKSRG